MTLGHITQIWPIMHLRIVKKYAVFLNIYLTKVLWVKCTELDYIEELLCVAFLYYSPKQDINDDCKTCICMIYRADYWAIKFYVLSVVKTEKTEWYVEKKRCQYSLKIKLFVQSWRRDKWYWFDWQLIMHVI